jgi:hypothetical protein
MNQKLSLSLPQIGNIRKGAGKIKKTGANGDYQTVGPDLKNKFRLDIFDGSPETVKKAVEVFGSLMPEKIIALLPFNSLQDCWQDYYEAYTKGRMIARADDTHFLRLVDLATGKVVVNNGEPFKTHTPGQILGTVGKTVIKTKRTGRLTLVIPALGRMATFTLHTTSIYDCVNMSGQLQAIQSIANAARLPLAGIPLSITRRLAEVTWVKETGESCRVTTGLIQIEADQTWVRYMLQDMARRALPSGNERPLELNAGEPSVSVGATDAQQAAEDLSGNDDPDYMGDPDGVDATYTDKTPATPPAQAPASAPMTLAEAEAVTNSEGKTYGSLDSAKLSYMANSLGKLAKRTPEQETKLLAIQIIMASRNADAALADETQDTAR